jgi:hypothetical protein
MPAGIGAVMSLMREVAVKRDALVREEREKNAAAANHPPQERLPAAEEADGGLPARREGAALWQPFLRDGASPGLEDIMTLKLKVVTTY